MLEYSSRHLVAIALLSTCCLQLMVSGTQQRQQQQQQQRPASLDPWANDPHYDYNGKEVHFGGGSGPRLAVHSGTKWCGAGNIAKSFNDLGSAFETDQCCRQHDYCGIYLRPNEVKYNYKNTFLYTISHCECDNNFYNCLKASKDAQARSVHYYFFYSLRMPCFDLRPMQTCVKRSLWDRIVGGCSKYEKSDTAVLMRLPQVNMDKVMPPLKFRTNRQ